MFESDYVKYLGILIDPHLKWNFHIDYIAPKLSRTIGMLSKLRHFVNFHTLRSIYFSIFSSIMVYGSQIWGQISNKHVDRISKLQDKAIRIINFASYNDSRGTLYKNTKILRFNDHIQLYNFLFIHDNFNKQHPITFNNYFTLINEKHNYVTRAAHKMHFSLPKIRTTIYGIKSISYQSILAWNYFIGILENRNLVNKSKSTCKKIITEHFLDSYD